MANQYYLVPNAAGTAFTGTGVTPDGTFPDGVILCTQAQAQNFQAYIPDMSTTPPSVVSAPSTQLLAQAQAAQISSLEQSWAKALAVVPVTINGTNYQIDNSPARQTYNISQAMSMQTIMAQAPAWTASTPVVSGTYCKLNGVYLYCSTSGKTAASAPTPPTTFGIPVTDGTAAWELLGRHIWLTNGTMQLFTPQEVLNGAMQIEAYIHQQNLILSGLKEQVNAATTVAAVQAVVWP